jgi:PAS domain S-box-containing protein
MTNLPINILIVDDEPKNLTVLETILDDPGYCLFRAESADQALLALVVEEFALIILDIRMPGMTGFELAQMIKGRKKTAHVPIIFLTAYYNEDQHVLEGYVTGAVDYLHKPVNPTILRSKVAVFAELHRKNRESMKANSTLLAEMTERRRAEERLSELNQTLEQRVAERTQALCESEERIRLATEATAVGIWEWNVKTNKVCWDAQMFRLYGVAPTADGLVEYETWSSAVIAEDLPQQEAILHDTIRRSGLSHRTFRIRRQDNGECRHIEAVETVRTNAQGQPEWVVGTNLDVTDRKQTEEELKNADRRKDEFLATLAHELRNPLAPIRNSLQILCMAGSDDHAAVEARSIMERQLGQMVRLVDDLLDVSRITRNRLELRKERTELAAVVHSAVETSRPLIEQSRHALSVTLPPFPVVLDADPVRLAQVFANLLNNSAKYTEPGGCIALSAETAGDDLVVRVRDNGVGIPPEAQPRIFTMFSQVDRTLQRAQGGLGIGLTLVKLLVEMHGGTVNVHSAGPGQGAEFVVRLPILVQEVRKGPGNTSREPQTELVHASPHRLLVVDDNTDAADSLATLLRLQGHEVRVAHDGPAALAMTDGYRPALVFLDLGMPGMDGYEVARRLRAQPGLEDVRLAALTGWGQENDRCRTAEAGFDHHFVKPVELKALEGLLAGLESPRG